MEKATKRPLGSRGRLVFFRNTPSSEVFHLVASCDPGAVARHTIGNLTQRGFRPCERCKVHLWA